MTTGQTFVIDCNVCRTKVAAIEHGLATNSDVDEGGPHGHCIQVGKCPTCGQILVGESFQIDFDGFNAERDRWSDVVRVFPKPPKIFSSRHMPRVIAHSLDEADIALQAGATIASCVMLGRALEALCRDILTTKAPNASNKSPENVMLAEGIRLLHENKVIDDRIYNWSQQLHAFRNLAAHPEDIRLPRRDVEDLQSFANAIVEYVYDLSERYEEFKERVVVTSKRKRPTP